MRIVAVAEPREVRRVRTAQAHDIPPERQFDSWEALLAQSRMARAAIIATQDSMHTEPAIAAMQAGYHVLLEKPMANRLEDCVALAQAAERTGRVLQICHVMRYTDFWQRLYEIFQSGRLGQIITISHRENVSSTHMAHSYVRGNWRNAEASSPMILAKSCHDLDILVWLLGAGPIRLSSIGSLMHFRPENAPPGAPKRCTDGCPAAASCPFYAPAYYIEMRPFLHGLSASRDPFMRWGAKLARANRTLFDALAHLLPAKGILSKMRELSDYEGWPRSVITDHPADKAALWEALSTGPYGRCVYKCDNTVVDHQVVVMEFPGRVSVSFTMHGHSHEEGRTIRIDGSHATVLGKWSHSQSYLEIHDHRTFEVERFDFANMLEMGGHGGGDERMMQAFVDTLRSGGVSGLSSARASLEGHLMAFAAEQARVEDSVIDMAAFRTTAEQHTAAV
jgi:predicted dehydrogenase